MSDETRIEPALTPKQWATLPGIIDLPDGTAAWIERDAPLPPDGAVVFGDGVEGVSVFPDAIPAAIAVLNAALPDDAPPKITRGMVRDIRETADLLRGELARTYGPEVGWGRVPRTLEAMATRAMAHAEALASYLPPE